MSMPSPIVAGDRDSWLDNGRPVADITREYLAGGSSIFPLAGQVALARASDDLTRDLGTKIYDVMLNDSTVSAGFYALLLAALNGPVQVIRRVEQDPDEEVAEGSERATDIANSEWAAEFCERALVRPDRPIKSLLWDIGHAWAVGVKLAEIRLEWGDGEDENYLQLASLKVKPNASWSFVVDPDQEVVAIRGTVVNDPVPVVVDPNAPAGPPIAGGMAGGIVDLPPDLFVILSTMGRDNDPRGRAILRGAYNGWNLKLNVWPKYYRYLDLHAMPITVGIAAPTGATEDAKDADGKVIPGQKWTATEAMYHALLKLMTGSVAALRNGSDIKYVQAIGNGEAFLNAISLFKQEILEGIMLTAQAIMEAKHSSKNSTESAQDVAGNVIAFLREGTSDAFTDQLFYRLILINRGKAFAEKYAPRLGLGRVEDRDRTALIAAMAQAGYHFSEGQFPTIDAELKVKVRSAEEIDRLIQARLDAMEAKAAPPGGSPSVDNRAPTAERPAASA